MFYEYSSMTTLLLDLSLLNSLNIKSLVTSEVKDMGHLFDSYINLSTLEREINNNNFNKYGIYV